MTITAPMDWATFRNDDATPEQVQAYSATLDAVHAFHDALSKAAPDAGMLDQLSADLRRWTDVLTPLAKPEVARLSGRLPALPVRGHLAIPPFIVDHADSEQIVGTVTFGAFFLGGGGAAHGGTILTVFDEVMGVQASVGGRKPARTAYLKTDFRSIVPIDEPIGLRVWFDREEGRKRYLRGEMRVGDTLCAEADALFIELRDAL
jgi:acyl-coenzyme A thioesterase PaaI-like protein